MRELKQENSPEMKGDACLAIWKGLPATNKMNLKGTTLQNSKGSKILKGSREG